VTGDVKLQRIGISEDTDLRYYALNRCKTDYDDDEDNVKIKANILKKMSYHAV
jgi:hypothetical protein